jgi:hypothetical protein
MAVTTIVLGYRTLSCDADWGFLWRGPYPDDPGGPVWPSADSAKTRTITVAGFVTHNAPQFETANAIRVSKEWLAGPGKRRRQTPVSPETPLLLRQRPWFSDRFRNSLDLSILCAISLRDANWFAGSGSGSGFVPRSGVSLAGESGLFFFRFGPWFQCVDSRIFCELKSSVGLSGV